MGQRLDLHKILTDILGSNFVYFQPPNGLKLQFPCIVYNRDNVEIDHADNNPYRHTKRYSITVIDRDPDSSIPDRVAEIRTASFVRFFTADDLNHDVYNIYF